MKKRCVGCGKQIPSVALDCVFCKAKQPAQTDDLYGDPNDRASLHATDETMVGFRMNDLAKAAVQEGASPATATAAAGGGESAATNGSHGEAAAFPAKARLTAAMPALVLPGAGDEEVSTPAEGSRAAPAELPRASEPRHHDRPFDSLGRTVMGVGGAILILLFFLPWHGVTSWRLLDTLSGADFVRQLFYLTGGIVLLATAALPVPFAFRAALGAAVAATPVVLGAGGVLEGWRGVVAGLAILALPATHLLRAQAKSSAAARGLVGAAVAAVAILYLVPISSVVPIASVFKMIGTFQVGPMVIGLFVLIPLVFAGLSLLGLLGRDLTDVGVLLSVLCLLWGPVVVALRGLMLEDGTQLYVALALLWASATSALSLAQLLSLAAHRNATA